MRQVTVGRYEIAIGDDIWCQLMPNGNSGQGGTVQSFDDAGVTMLCGTAQYERTILWSDVHHVAKEVPYDADECINFNDLCAGPVEMRWPGSGHRNWLRCEFHGEQRLANVSELERCADSDVAPSWFDPANAGECWDAD